MSLLEHPAPSAAATETTLPAEVDIAIVGSGFSGLAMAVRLRRAGFRDFVILERAQEVGGTWRDNSYPGCACDVPSHLYSFSFAPNPEWSSTFSPQPEIQSYLRKVAEDQRILPHVHFGAEMQEARWDPAARRWQVTTARGSLAARVLIAASGPLSEPSVPELPGLDRFRGKVFHSARWDHEHDLSGERVAVIGTGASAIQFVPQIQPRVDKLHLFQRTPPWVMPRRTRPLTRVERAIYRWMPGAQRLMRAAIYWGRELYAIPLMRASLAPITRRLGRANLRRQVPDPALREKLTPHYAPGCKRILISNDYYPALSKPNVDVVTDGIGEVRENTVVTTDGSEHEVDTIIFGTGFHVTDMPIIHRLRGGDGRSMAETNGGMLQAHRGTTVAGFPNLFLLLGPNTGLGHTSVVVMAEAQVGYIVGALRHMRDRAVDAIEVRPDAQAAWNSRLQAAMPGTVWTAGGCSSWYMDASGRVTTLWPDFTFNFRRILRHFDADSYEASPTAPARKPGRVGAPAVAA
jgi:cation diffusion facilitator CzcD-associated flavoprotein CzcO